MKKTAIIKRVLAVLLAAFLLFGMTPDISLASAPNDEEMDANEEIIEEIVEEEHVVSSETVISNVDRKEKKESAKSDEQPNAEDFIDETEELLGEESALSAEGGSSNPFDDLLSAKISKDAFAQNFEYGEISPISIEFNEGIDADKYILKYQRQEDDKWGPESETIPSVSITNFVVKVNVYTKDGEISAEPYCSKQFTFSKDMFKKDIEDIEWNSDGGYTYSEDEDGNPVEREFIAHIGKNGHYDTSFNVQYLSGNSVTLAAEATNKDIYTTLSESTLWKDTAKYENAGDYKFYLKITAKGYSYYTLTPKTLTVNKCSQNMPELGDISIMVDSEGEATLYDKVPSLMSLRGPINYTIISAEPSTCVIMKPDESVVTDPELPEPTPDTTKNKSGIIIVHSSGKIRLQIQCEGDENHTQTGVKTINVSVFNQSDDNFLFFENSSFDFNDIGVTKNPNDQMINWLYQISQEAKPSIDIPDTTKIKYSIEADNNSRNFAMFDNKSWYTYNSDGHNGKYIVYKNNIDSLKGEVQSGLDLTIKAEFEGFYSDKFKASIPKSEATYTVHLVVIEDISLTDKEKNIIIKEPSGTNGWYNRDDARPYQYNNTCVWAVDAASVIEGSGLRIASYGKDKGNNSDYNPTACYLGQGVYPFYVYIQNYSPYMVGGYFKFDAVTPKFNIVELQNYNKQPHDNIYFYKKDDVVTVHVEVSDEGLYSESDTVKYESTTYTVSRGNYDATNLIDSVSASRNHLDLNTVPTEQLASGIDRIEWKLYALIPDSEGKLKEDATPFTGGTVSIEDGTINPDTGEADITLPSEAEYYANLHMTLYDMAGNVTECNSKIISVGNKTENASIIYDEDAPEFTVTFSPNVSEEENEKYLGIKNADGKEYYRTDVRVDISLHEFYFDPDSFDDLIQIEVKKDGEKFKNFGTGYGAEKLTFSPVTSDAASGTRVVDYIASFVLQGDGEYVVSVDAEDYSGNKAESVKYPSVVIDTIAPKINAVLSDPPNGKKDGDTIYYGIVNNNSKNYKYAQAIDDIEIIERNFEAEDVHVLVYSDKSVDPIENFTYEWSDKPRTKDDESAGNGGNTTGKFSLSSIGNFIFGTPDEENESSSEEGSSEEGSSEEGSSEEGSSEEGSSEEGSSEEATEEGSSEEGSSEEESTEEESSEEITETDPQILSSDHHFASLSLSSGDSSESNLPNNFGDGEYCIIISYVDKAGNIMTYSLEGKGSETDISTEPEQNVTDDVCKDTRGALDDANPDGYCYRSKKLVLDTVIPDVKVSFKATPKNTLKEFRGENKYKYFNNNSLTADISIVEKNFTLKGVNDEGISAKDLTGRQIDYGKSTNLINSEKWTNSGDTHTNSMTFSAQANYDIKIKCVDLAGNSGESKPEYFTLDRTPAKITSIKYSTPILDTVLNGITFGFYNTKINVTVEAEDNIAGVHEFNYSYVKAAGVSGVNAQLLDQVVSEDKIKYNDNHDKASITFTIPKDALDANHQFNGTVKVSVSDRSDNKANKEDDKRLVADNIAPNATVTYNAPIAENNGKVYYASDINGTITINEANFYASDVQILVTKNGAENTFSTSWTDESTDVHVGRFTLVEEGEYIVKINYKDKSSNAMNEYVSELMVIDKTIEAPVFKINGVNKDGDNGGAYKGDLNVAYEFSDQNFKSATTKLTKTRFDEKNDITEQYIKTTTTANGGNGTFDIAKDVDSDGIYLLEVSMSDYAGHTIDSFVKFTANRYGSVYEYSDYLAWIISDGGQFIKLTGDETVTEDLVITEYNPDMVESGSLNITATRDGEAFDVFFTTTPSDMNRSAEPSSNSWYKYVYTISKQNFQEDGTYKLSISSSDATGNTSISVPENSIDSNGNKILDVMGFTVDTTCPELKNIINLEDSVIRSSNLEVKYSIVDLGGIKSIEAYVDGQPVATAADLTVGLNNYNGSFFVGESDVAQEVRIVIEDIAGNVTDTDDAQWKQEQERAGSYVFKNPVTVSTNFMVLWLANKLVFFGSIGAASVLVIGGAIFIIAKKTK